MEATKRIPFFLTLTLFSILTVSSCAYWQKSDDVVKDTVAVVPSKKVDIPKKEIPPKAPEGIASAVEQTKYTDVPVVNSPVVNSPVINAPVSPIVKAPVAPVVLPSKVTPPATPTNTATMTAPTPTPASTTTQIALSSIKGKITILDKDGKSLPANDVIINIEPLSADAKVALAKKGASTSHAVTMEKKHFSPSALTVRVGDSVSFNNKDAIKHNVFSSSGKNTFDMGTYGLGGNKSTQLVAPGIVKVYCNIHIEMVNFVSVSEWNTSYITKTDGNYVIKGLPAGEYNVKVWHVRGETSKRLTIKPNENLIKDISLNTVAYKETPHLNKKGESYKIKPALFQDEFY